LNSAGAIAASAKHYVGYGAAEAGREYNSTWIPEGLLREVYLRPFQAARDAGVATFMPGFNALNGVPATGNIFTLQEILRREWKFGGMVVSDYTAIPEMVQHGYAADAADAARKALLAGVDMEMVSTTYYDHLKALVEKGLVDPKTIDAAVRNILRLKFQLGLFDEKPGVVGDQHAAGVRPPGQELRCPFSRVRIGLPACRDAALHFSGRHAAPISRTL